MTTAKRIGKIASWLFTSIAWAALGVLGLTMGVAWASHLWVFWLWVMVIGYTLVAVTPKTTPMESGVPGWVAFTYDVALTIFVASTGHWFYAFLVLYQGIMEASIRASRRLVNTVPPAAS